MYENDNILSNQDRVIKISGIACFHKYSCSTNVLLLDQTECNEQNCYTHGQSDPFPTQRDICYQPNWPHFILICTKWIILIKRLNSLSLSIQSNRCCLFYVITSVINPDHVWHLFLGSMVLTQFFMIFFIVNILNINMKVFKIIYILCILPASIYYLALFR